MTDLERDIESRLRKIVERNGGKCLKWVCPGWRGIPDRIVLLPGGRVIFAELKRKKTGRISEMQKYWARKLTDMGFHYCIIWDRKDLELFTSIYFGEHGNEIDDK